MIRLIAPVIGLGFVAALALALFSTISGAISEPAQPTAAEEFHLKPRDANLASAGMFGKFDKRQAQRGFQVYKEVCSNCHSLTNVSFRDLEQLGYSEAEVKKIAADWGTKQPTFDPKTGDRADRPNLPSDRFPAVYYAGQGNPPNLSLITKAREEGPDYVYSLLTGYQKQPDELLKHFPDAKTPDGLYYNPYFPNLNLAMPPPLTADGQVTYTDGTKPSVDQMAKDVSEFLTWTAEPNLETRHQAGFAVIVFLAAFCFLAWGAYQNVWREVKH
jgi:ubiquinol-cytochrome c reductase cytochrome c1 subunit